MMYTDYPSATEQPLCLTEVEWKTPKTVISALFEINDYVDLKKMLRRWLKIAMTGHRQLLREDLSYTQDLKDELGRLLEMACLLEPDDKSRLRKKADWMDSQWWISKLRGGRIPFDYFPASLSAREYREPYKALQNCLATYSLPTWRKLLEDCWMAGLTTDTLFALQDMETAVHTCRLLPKLLDAAHLIYVRELATTTPSHT
jgi:hypothetical protein